MNDERLRSFDFADELLRKLARKEIFPNLEAIVISGHSAGGQFVTRGRPLLLRARFGPGSLHTSYVTSPGSAADAL
jgi:hypothetical protein